VAERPPKLAELRAELTRVDEELVALLARRMQVVGEVAELKAKVGLPPFDRGQEAEKMK